ncbi:hypothetical protein AX289_29340 [Methylorubrum populi]|nr:hypothetical protein AX289_29340 [Methylorubrum populi]
MLILSVGSAAAQEAADRCRDILVHAAHNINQSFRTTNMASDVKNAMCNTSSGSTSSNRSGSGGLVVFGAFGMKGRGANQQIQQMRNQVCSSSQNELSDNQLDQALSNLVDHESVAAWRACMDNQGTGLIGTIERDEDLVVVRLQWVARFDVDRAAIQAVQVSGVECPSMWAPGTAVGSVPLIVQCNGSRAKAVSIVVQTDRDAIRLRSPVVQIAIPQEAPAQDATPAKSERERCFDGESSLCDKLARENTARCARSGGSPVDMRMCQQESILLQDMSTGTAERDRACAGDRNGSACRVANERLDGILGRAEAPPLPGFLPPRPALR